MDSKKFFLELRKIIREEVNMAITSVLTESVKKSPQRHNNVAGQNGSATSLQQLLSETSDDTTSNTLHFTSQDAPMFDRATLAAKLGYGDVSPANTSMIPTHDNDGNPIKNVTPEVRNIITRDYRGLMKAINKKNK